MDRKKLAHIIVGLPIMHIPDLMDPDVSPKVLERPEFSIRDIEIPVLQNPNGMTNRQIRRHEKTRKRKGRK